jgi:serpin B
VNATEAHHEEVKVTAIHTLPARRRALIALVLGALGTGSGSPAHAQASPPKDVVVDVQAGPTAPSVPAAAASHAAPPATAAMASRQAFVASVADLGLHFLRENALSRGHSQDNAVSSPFSVASALGMLHAGAAGETAREISAVLEPQVSGGRLMRAGLRSLVSNVQADEAAQWVSANRIWVTARGKQSLAPAFADRLKNDFKADAAVVNFTRPDVARAAVNEWVGTQTAGAIREILPAGALRPTTKVVLTNVAWFRGTWIEKFDRSATKDEDFRGEQQVRKVPTMHQVLTVREALVDNVHVLELPFEGGSFSLLLALPPAGQRIEAFEAGLNGAELAAWLPLLKSQRVNLSLPRFEIQPAAQSLNDAMSHLGVVRAFSQQADFSAMMNTRDLKLDAILHSAGIKVDEEGTVASAATAAVAASKSMSLGAPPVRRFDRPFLFALMHKPTGAPLFIGRVAMP